MTLLRWAGAVLLSASAAAVPVRASAGSVEGAAAAIAVQAAEAAEPSSTVVAIAVDAPARALEDGLETSLAAELRAAGFRAVVAARNEKRARSAGADGLIRLAAGIEGTQLVVTGSFSSVRENFFTGTAVVGGGRLEARVPADAAARLLARRGRPAGELHVKVERFAELPAAPIALAVGDLDADGEGEVVALGVEEIFVVRPSGEVLRHELPPAREGAVPSRDPAGAVIIVDGTIHYALPSRGLVQRLVLQGGVLQVEGDGDLAGPVPLAAGGAGVLAGAPHRGRNTFAPGLRLSEDVDGKAPRAATLPAPIVAALAAPGGGDLPFGVITEARAYLPLDPALEARTPIPEVGAAAALADLDGDGNPELVASGAGAGAPDRIRVLRPAGGAEIFASEPIPAALVAGAAGILEEGEEAILAGASEGGALLYRVRGEVR